MIGNGIDNKKISGNHGETNFIGIFGEQNAEPWQTDISVNFVYGVNETDDVIDGSSGTGALSKVGSLCRISSGASGIGKFTTIDRVRYRNGHSLASRFTLELSSKPISAKIVIIKNGSPTDVKTLDVDSIDWTKLNIFQQGLGYLGVAPIVNDIMKVNSSSFAELYAYRPHGKQTGTHISNPYSAFTCEVTNTRIRAGLYEADSGVLLEFEYANGEHYAGVGSVFAGVLASNLSPSNRPISYGRRVTGLAAATFAGGKYRNIATFNSKTTFNSVENKILSAIVSIKQMIFDTGADGDYEIVLAKNATPDAPFAGWTDVDTNRSGVRVSETDTLFTATPDSIKFKDFGYVVAATGASRGSFRPGTTDAIREGLTFTPGSDTYSLGVMFDNTFGINTFLKWDDLF